MNNDTPTILGKKKASIPILLSEQMQELKDGRTYRLEPKCFPLIVCTIVLIQEGYYYSIWYGDTVEGSKYKNPPQYFTTPQDAAFAIEASLVCLANRILDARTTHIPGSTNGSNDARGG